MKRILLISIFLLLLFFVPSQIFAMECIELNVKVFLACEENNCAGFSVREKYKGGVCERLPYVFDLKENNGDKIHNYLHVVTGLLQRNGFWMINMDSSCYYALLDNRNDNNSQKRVNGACGQDGERIDLTDISNKSNEESLQSIREVEEKKARSVRTSFYLSQVFWGAVSIILGALLPLIIILLYLKTRDQSLVRYYVVPFILIQICIIIFLSYLSSIFYPPWGMFSLAIISPLFLIEIGLLIGAKLENRYHKMRP
ncbi:MAG: hypothetical protein GY803_14685 [Chloroflexi bacterium]|nr:hypothetical protein [Chloroflexota bacterium]